MSPITLLPARAVSEAKKALSEVMDEVVREHRPQIVQRNDWKDAMALISLEDLRSVVSSFRFDPRVTYGLAEVVLSLDQMGLVASGPSLEAAADTLVLELREYCADLIGRFDYFRYTKRARDLPWVLRFSLASPEEQRELLFEEPGGLPEPAREQLAASR